jgi:hypothetical protein
VRQNDFLISEIEKLEMRKNKILEGFGNKLKKDPYLDDLRTVAAGIKAYVSTAEKLCYDQSVCGNILVTIARYADFFLPRPAI